MWAKQSTAATLIVGPILDSTGAEYTSAVIGDLSISKNGGTLTALAAAATLTHIANGQYTLVLTAGNTDTLGRAQITCNKSTYQMPEVRLMVVPAMVFDSMILGSDRFDANVTHVADTAQTARDIGASVLLSNGTGAGQVKLASGYVAMTWADIGSPTTIVNLSGTTVKTATDVESDTADIQARLPAALVSGRMDSSVGAMAADTLTAAAIAASAVTEIQSGLATSTNVSDAQAAIIAQGNSAWATATGFSTHSAADVVTAIGTASTFTAVPWNPAWDAEVQSEVQDAIEVNNLDHLVKIAVDADFQTTVHLNSVLGHLADNGTSATFSRTTDSLEAIRDRGDAAWTTGSGGGGGGGTMSEAVVVAKVEVGATVGWPDQFTIGDAYLSATNTAPKLFIKDLDDNILDGLGDKMFSDADFVGVLRFVPVNDTTREQGTPAATIEVSTEDAVGIAYNDDTADSEFFALQIPRAKSSLAQVRTRYLAQFIMNWDSERTYERTVHLGEVQFVRKANPVA